ncbi:MAG: PASTA domain-containing protein [Elusimicrobia bacterium]|nr:PASTA domain-containing protein [Elusimicrobiota bacterium]
MSFNAVRHPSEGAPLGSSSFGAPASPEPGAGRRPLKRYEIAAAALCLAVFTYFMAQWALEGVIHSRKVQAVPDMRGRPLEAALDMASSLNLALRKEGSEFNASIPIGAVLRQLPEAGTKVREGKVIRVIVSQGGETVFVPGLSGLPLRNAEMLLRQNQLLLGAVTESYSLRMDKGTVLLQDPKAEASVERSHMINVVISGGPPPNGVSLMPDFTRKNVSDANAWASPLGISVEIVKDSGSLFPYGVVLAQEPAPDTILEGRSRIKLTVSGRSSRSGGAQAPMRRVHYAVPQGSSDSQVRIVLTDPYGEQEIFNGLRPPGSKVDVDIPTPETGKAHIKVYLNGILVEERNL